MRGDSDVGGLSVKGIDTLLLLFYGRFVSNVLSLGNLSSFDGLVNFRHIAVVIFRQFSLMLLL